jgi:hypothetical protein
VLVDGGQAVAGVDEEQHHVRLFHRQQGLLGHGRIDTNLIAADPASVDDNETAPVKAVSLAVLAVAGQAGESRPPAHPGNRSGG